MCGSVVNEDASLGFSHTTSAANKVSVVTCEVDSILYTDRTSVF